MDKDIIQNALQVNETGQIIVSHDTHDYVTDKTGNYSVDGGLDYIKRNCKDSNYTELNLCEDSSFEQVIEKTVWGTYGKGGKDPLKYVFLKDCELEHLVAIKHLFKARMGRIRKLLEFLIEKKIQENAKKSV